MRAVRVVALALVGLALAAPGHAHARVGHADVERGRGTFPDAAAPSTEGTALSISAAVAASLNRRVGRNDLSCPAGVPVQTLTVVNEANVRASALAKVENAIVAQSEQLRDAWGTPCVQFGPSGWLVYLQTGYTPNPFGGYTMQLGGEHYGIGVHGPAWQGQPYVIVKTGGETYASWSYAFSHEIAEMLVDPTDTNYYTWPNGIRELLDLRSGRGLHITLDGVSVDDFRCPRLGRGARLRTTSRGVFRHR